MKMLTITTLNHHLRLVDRPARFWFYTETHVAELSVGDYLAYCGPGTIDNERKVYQVKVQYTFRTSTSAHATLSGAKFQPVSATMLCLRWIWARPVAVLLQVSVDLHERMQHYGLLIHGAAAWTAENPYLDCGVALYCQADCG